MKRIALLAVGILAFTSLNVHAQNVIIYGTYDDWTNNLSGNGGYTAAATSAFSYGGITVNGVGNPTAPGVTSPDGAGALQVSPVIAWSPWNGAIINAPNPTLAVLQALDGQLATSSSLVNQSGTMYVYYTRPDDDIAGSYWNGLAIFHNYDGSWGYWFPSSEVDLGPVSTPSGTEELYEAIIPYAINATTLTYFSWGFDESSDYQGSNPWYIASVQAFPIPQTIIPAPVQSLFTTSNDFAAFTSAGGDLVLATNDWFVTTNTDNLNGLGNPNSPGASGTPGSLLLYWSSLESGWGDIADAPAEFGNTAFMQAIDPGQNGTNLTAAYGNIYMDFSQPDNSGGGNYFQLGVILNYYGTYGTFFPSSTTDLGYQDNSGYEVYQAMIPYNINAVTAQPNNNYFGFSIAVNSNYQPTNGFHIDDISVSSAQAPLITSTSLSGTSLVIQGTNGLTGYSFNLNSATNLAQAQWTPVVRGVPFNGPNWSVTNAISGSQAFYRIETVAP